MVTSPHIDTSAYAHPESLVSAEELQAHLRMPLLSIIDCNCRATYLGAHLPGAAHLYPRTALRTCEGGVVNREAFAAVLKEQAITTTPGGTLVFYSDNANFEAAFAYWVFQLYGYTGSAYLLNGGWQTWQQEERPQDVSQTVRQLANFSPPGPQVSRIRACSEDLQTQIQNGGVILDAGTLSRDQADALDLKDANLVSVPWGKAVTSTGAFRSPAELYTMYVQKAQLQPADKIVVLNNAHTWFVLTRLLGFTDVQNFVP